jgi:hypothetical protein
MFQGRFSRAAMTMDSAARVSTAAKRILRILRLLGSVVVMSE